MQKKEENMYTYDKIEKMPLSIMNIELINKNNLKDFTRNRKIRFEDIIYFILNKRGLSLNMEINKFQEKQI